MMEYADIVVIGGGAAGLAAAITAKREAPEAKVLILESTDRVGKKILETGNGRCNLTNLSVSPEDYNAPGFVEPIISQYPFEEVARFFLSLGLAMEDDGQGRVFPKTYTATSVLDVLRLGCRENGIEIRCEVDVDEIAAEVWDEEDEEEEMSSDGAAGTVGATGATFHDEPRIVIRIDKQIIFARRVILATGALKDAKTRKLLTDLLGPDALTELRPGLVPLETETEFIKGLSGIRVKCAGTLFDLSNEQTRVLFSGEGEILFRDYGISGILAMDFSRYLREEGEYVCFLNLIPGLSYNELELMLRRRLEIFPGRTAREFLVGVFQSRVADAVLKMADIPPNDPITPEDVEDLLRALKSFRISIKGPAPRQKPQVTCGGVSRSLIDPETLETTKVNGIYVVGESLDVDGRCGGFNLHWAWASGIVAGKAAAAAVNRLLPVAEEEAETDTDILWPEPVLGNLFQRDEETGGADEDGEAGEAAGEAAGAAGTEGTADEGPDGKDTGKAVDGDGPADESEEGPDIDPEADSDPDTDVEPWMGFDDESSVIPAAESALDIPIPEEPAPDDLELDLDLEDLDSQDALDALSALSGASEPLGPDTLLDQLAWGIPMKPSSRKGRGDEGQGTQVTADSTFFSYGDDLEDPVLDTAEMEAYASGMPTMDASVMEAALGTLTSDAAIEKSVLDTLTSEAYIPTI